MHTPAAPQDGYLRALDGPWAGYELGMTRALGHKNMAHRGVIAEPYVVKLTLKEEHCCLVSLVQK